jgi:hypothetical protein
MTLLNAANGLALGGAQASRAYLGSAQVWAAGAGAAFTDITGQIVNPTGGGYQPAKVAIPAWGGNYAVTVSVASTPYSAFGLGVSFPTPANPNIAHTVTVRYALVDRACRVYHQMLDQAVGRARFEHADGLTIEPLGQAGTTTTITYRWSVALQSVVVDSYSGPVLTRDHGHADATAHLVPLYFTPELKAEPNFAQVKASHLRVLGALPLAHREFYKRQNTIISIPTPQDPLACIFNRGIFDGAFGSGISGLATGGNGFAYVYADPTSVYDSTGTTVESRVMIHELGHVIGNFWQKDQGLPYGRIPYVPAPGQETVTYWPGTSQPRQVETTLPGGYSEDGTQWAPNVGALRFFDVNGNQTGATTYGFYQTRDGKIENEQDIWHLWKLNYNQNVYYRSEPDEFVAENFAIYYAQFVPGVSQLALDTIVTNVGGWAVHNKFVDYCKSIGLIEGAPSDSTPPGPVTSLTATANYGNYYQTGYVLPWVTLNWTKPTASDLSSYTVRRATGTTAPATRSDGNLIASYGPAHQFAVDSEVVAGTTYSYAIWARDYSGNYSTRQTVTVTVPA